MQQWNMCFVRTTFGKIWFQKIARIFFEIFSCDFRGANKRFESAFEIIEINSPRDQLTGDGTRGVNYSFRCFDVMAQSIKIYFTLGSESTIFEHLVTCLWSEPGSFASKNIWLTIFLPQFTPLISVWPPYVLTYLFRTGRMKFQIQ